MFAEAFEIAVGFTRPILSVARYYGSTEMHRGTATLFFVNTDGWALTCRHVVEGMTAGTTIREAFDAFKSELSTARNQAEKAKLRRKLKRKYKYTSESLIELHHNFVDCVPDGRLGSIIRHPEHDVALIKFEQYSELLCKSFPIFPADTGGLRPGRYLCRLGFPFPEFANYAYDEEADRVIWNDEGRQNTPLFPIEGMVTRLVGRRGNVCGFEVSTPGLRGQSGGPAFDVDGKVWGMQAATRHLDLDFDVDQQVMRKGKPKRVQESTFLHVGRCVHVEALKGFMRDHDVEFEEV